MSKARLLLIFIIIFLAFPTVNAVTIHGTVFEWSTFEPLDNALMEVNSTPAQFRVAASGVYSFNLPPGDYLFRTSYYRNDTLLYYNEETLSVTGYEGDYVHDILLFPLEEEEEEFLDEDVGNVTYDVEDGTLPGFDWTYTFIALLALVIAGGAAYLHYRKRDVEDEDTVPGIGIEVEPAGPEEPHPEEIEETAVTTKAALSDDLKEIIGILESSGGRITQKDLRAKLRCSEAKVSLMVTDLEDRGLVHKVRKGRGNVILLEQGDS